VKASWRGDGWLKGTRWLRSPNQGVRPAGCAVSLVVLHNISLPPGEFGGPWIERLFTNRLDPAAHPYFSTIAGLQVSAHFVVRRGGEIVQLVGCDRRAWHAGQSAWRGRANCNDWSLGIELEGSDDQPFVAEQYHALWRLLDAIRGRYPITAIVGHSDVAPGRKTDPGPHFDWAAVAARHRGLELPPEIARQA
jgi:AmpD protein